MISVGVHCIYIYIYIHSMFVDQKNYFNCTLAIDSLFQTFARIYRLALSLCTMEMLSSLSKSRIFFFLI